MSVHKLRAAATALLLGTAVLGAGAAFHPAQAQSVSAAVGGPLNEAKSLVASKRFSEAKAKVDAAAAAAKTPAENAAVKQMKDYLAVSSGDTSTGLGAKAKFANDANAGRWRDVIADADALRKTGALDAQSHLVIAQAYYSLNDPKNCMSYIRTNLRGSGSESVLALLQRCAYDAGDEVTQRQSLEQLVASTGKAEHWKGLLRLAERSKGIKDHQTLDIYRIKALTGNLTTADEVSTYAQIAVQLKFAAEAEAVVQKGFADKTLPVNERNNRLLKLATDRARENAAAAPKALADAQKAPKGDALVQFGEDQIGQGKAKDAIATIQAGIAKTPVDMANAQLRLGTAYLAAGQKGEAARAFAAVKGDDKVMMVAHLYELVSRSSAAPAATAAEPSKGKKRK